MKKKRMEFDHVVSSMGLGYETEPILGVIGIYGE